MMDEPEVTEAMIAAAWREYWAGGSSITAMLTAIYRAMRLARPLSDGPGV